MIISFADESQNTYCFYKMRQQKYAKSSLRIMCARITEYGRLGLRNQQARFGISLIISSLTNAPATPTVCPQACDNHSFSWIPKPIKPQTMDDAVEEHAPRLHIYFMGREVRLFDWSKARLPMAAIHSFLQMTWDDAARSLFIKGCWLTPAIFSGCPSCQTQCAAQDSRQKFKLLRGNSEVATFATTVATSDGIMLTRRMFNSRILVEFPHLL